MKKQEQGFTLVELAVVFVVIGLLVGMGVSLIGPLTRRAKRAETKERVKEMKEAIIGYALTKKEMPCDGSETCSGADGDARFNTLARPSDLSYIYSGNLRQEGANIDLCTLSATNITLQLCHDNSCTSSDTINNTAFIVLHRGGNFNKQTNGNGIIPAATTVIIYDYGIGNVPDGDTSDSNRTEEFDDIVEYVTLPELQGKMCTPCTAYEIWNNLGANTYFRVNGIGCNLISDNSLITSLTLGGSINGYTDVICSIPAVPPNITHANAVSIDSDGDCIVNYNGSDR